MPADGSVAAAPRMSYVDNMQKNGNGSWTDMLVKAVDFFQNAPTRFVPNSFMVPTGKLGVQEDPGFIYPNSMLPCLDQRFLIVFENDTVNRRLVLSKTSLESISLLTSGQGNSGASLNLWWPQTYADTTIQKEGALVYRGHTFWGSGHTFAFELGAYRAGEGTAADALATSRNLMDGAGSYVEQGLALVAHNVGFMMRPAASECPIYLGNIAYNGDMAQLRGPGLPSIADPQLPFKTWERPVNFGSKDSPFQMNAQLTMGPQEVAILYTDGNEPISDLYLGFRLRVCGWRECGEYVPGCRVQRVIAS